MDLPARSTSVAKRQVPAVSRAISILDYLASAKEPLGVVPLARHIGLIPSTCLHILRALADEGLVMVNSQTKQYSIGAGVLSLARAYARRDPLIQVTSVSLEGLSQRHGCAFAALERNGADQCIVVAIGDAQAGMSVRVSVGARFPALISATGICFAAFGAMSESELREGFDVLRWENPIAFDDWLDEVARTHDRGFAIDDGYFISGTRIVAVPVFRPDRSLLGCIAAVGLRDRLTQEPLERLTDDLQGVAQECSAALTAGLDASSRI